MRPPQPPGHCSIARSQVNSWMDPEQQQQYPAFSTTVLVCVCVCVWRGAGYIRAVVQLAAIFLHHGNVNQLPFLPSSSAVDDTGSSATPYAHAHKHRIRFFFVVYFFKVIIFTVADTWLYFSWLKTKQGQLHALKEFLSCRGYFYECVLSVSILSNLSH